MIKVRKHYSKKHDKTVYVICEPDIKKLEAIIKRYNIKVSPFCMGSGELLFYKPELDEITEQYKLARKKEQQK